jgi:hypothetical protein
MLWAIFPQAIFTPNQRSVHTNVKLHSRTLHSEIHVLIDSGATENFITPDVIEFFNIPTFKLPKPRTICNVDGTKNSIGEVTKATNLDISYKGKRDVHIFYVIDLENDHMLLGMPFMAATDPDMDWTKGEIYGMIIAASSNAHKWIPDRDKKVHKPFHNRMIGTGYKLQDEPSAGHLQFFNFEPDDYTFIRQTTISTKLAADATNKEEIKWQDLMPAEYHKYGKVFSNEEAQHFPASRPWDHTIDLIPEAPATLNCKVYPLAPGQQKALDKFLDEHLKKGYIRCSKSPYASPFFFVGKKDGKKLRPTQDYHALNNLTMRNTYPLPLIKELINQLVKKEWFTKFDIRWGYNNVCIKDGDQWKAAFKTNRELFEPMVMYFGLTNSPVMFQTIMDKTFKEEMATGNVVIYIDNILIATPGSLNYHKRKVAQILEKLQEHNLFLKPEKCHFHKREVEYLGVIVGKGQAKMDPVKVQGLTDWPTPTNLKELCSFLGFGNYYKDFINGYSHVAQPLYELTKKNIQWHWNDQADYAFKTLKSVFTAYPVLRNPDLNKRYILDTDASQFAVGATLSQHFSDRVHPIAFFSKSLLPAERNYDIYDQELLAIIYAIKAFRHLLLGAQQKFLIRTNHENLKYFKSLQKITTCQARWNTFLQDYDFEITHIPGKNNTIADILSQRKDFEEGVNPTPSITILPE